VLVAGGLTVTAYALIRHDRSYSHPYGIPAAVPDSQVNLMKLSPVPARSAPGFTLTDQDGRVLALSAFRGKVVVLESWTRTAPTPARSCRTSSPTPAATWESWRARWCWPPST